MPASTEKGFVLISALWLLLLGASLTALLTLRSITSARDARTMSDVAVSDASFDDTVEAIASDLLFHGQASAWSALPTQQQVTIDGRSMMVDVYSEDDLADVNQAEPRVIDGLLQDKGYSAEDRVVLLGQLALTRTERRKLTSLADVASVAAGVVPSPREDCLLDVASPFGHRVAAASGASAGVHVGSTLRLAISYGSRRRLYVLRMITANDRPYALLDVYDDHCPAPSGAA